jgi:thioredoxin-related protein
MREGLSGRVRRGKQVDEGCWQMKMRIVVAVVAFALAIYFARGKALWGMKTADMPTYPKALAEAKAHNKIVLADFTGSDWCPYCMQLQQEVLQTAEFQRWGGLKFVNLEVDFPRLIAIPDDVKKQNKTLYDHFSVTGFPTVLLIDGDGKELGRVVGYGGKDRWTQGVLNILAEQGR